MVLSKTSFITFVFLLYRSFVFSQDYPDSNVHLMLYYGIEKIVLQNYDDAKQIFSKLDKEYPAIPLGKIYLAAVEIAHSYDYAEPYQEEFINSMLEEAVKQSSELIEADKNNIWNIYFLALSKGYMSYYYALNEDWLSAFSLGIESVNAFEKCLELNPDFYEAFTALGSYKYWKSRKTEFLHWLPFIKDENQVGIEYLKKAITHSSYNTYLAINSLIWIYIDKGEFDSAVRISLQALEKYPGCRFFKYGLARAYEEIDHNKAVECYLEILYSFPQTYKYNGYNEIELKHKIAQQYAKMGEKQKALALCKEILDIKHLSEDVRKRLSNRLDRIKTLQKELSE